MVDDNVLAAQALERYFKRSGLIRWLGWCGDPAEAVERVAELKPDVVLLDVEIPGADCFAALQEMVSLRPSLRVVMFSGHAQTDLIDRALREGATGYIVKDDPVDAITPLLVDASRGQCVLSSTASSVYMRSNS